MIRGWSQSAVPELKPLLVLDKSFANWKSGSLAKFASNYTLLVPSAFYFEVFTTDPKKRVRELKNFPSFRHIHTPSLQRIENETGRPATSIDTPVLRFNPEAENESWRLGPEYVPTLEKYRSASVQPDLDFWRQVCALKGVPGFSESELTATKGTPEEFIRLCELLRSEARVRSFADNIGWDHAGKLDSNWFHYRLFQAWALHGLVLLRRHPNLGDFVGETQLEHDVQDIEYLTLGLHAGALATAEISRNLKKASLAWRFRTLDPNGLLIEP